MTEENGGQAHERRHEEAEEMARLQEQINNLPVSEHVLYMMHSLSSLAIDRLGLVAEAESRRDVQQARLAIDAFKALLGVLEEARPTEEIAAHRGVLSQLQMAYVGALGAGAPPEQGPHEDAPTAADTEPGPEPEDAPQSAPEAEPKAKAKKAAKPRTASTAKPGSKSGGSASAKGGKKGA